MYRVLYRKWRPQCFSDVVGQEHITSTLAHEVETGKVSHAYLFTGSRGTGKTTCAKILAKAVNCLHPVNGDPCNECEICKGIDDGSILDVIEIDAASNNGVDNIRDLREEANFTPVHAAYRVYIIDEVHMLSIGAFNALLKTLEEPPEHVKFILATTEVHKLPSTILSRCQRYDFRRITPEHIVKRLEYVAEKEAIELDSEAALLIARIADGALRDALSILDRCSGISNKVTVEAVGEATGLAGKSYLFDLVDSILNCNAAEALEIITRLHNDSCDMERLCTELINHYRNLMIIKTAKNPRELIICTESDLEKYKNQAEKTTLRNILTGLEILEESSIVIKNVSNKRTQAEMMTVKLASPETNTDYSHILQRLEKLEKAISSGNITVKKEETITKSEPEKEVSEPEPYIPESEEPARPQESRTAENSKEDSIFTGWSEVIEQLNVTDKPLIGILGNSSAYIRNDFLLIKCDNPVFSQFIRQSNHAAAIKKAVFDVTGRKFRLGIYKTSEDNKSDKDPLADLIKKISD